MEQNEHGSDVARVRANIEAECEALTNLSLFSRTASHDIINARFKALDAHYQELRATMPDSEAIYAMVAFYNKVVH
jgi:hypothetical protein